MKQRDVLIVDQHPDINIRAQRILEEALVKAGFKPDKIRMLNVLEHAPPEGKNVTKTMIKAGKDQLLKKIDKYDPSLILALGNTPMQALMDQTGIRNLRGKPIEWNHSSRKRVVMPVYHPNYALHDDKWVDVIEQDMVKMKECFDFGGIPEERELDYHIVDTWEKVKAMLKDLSGTIATDLECTRLYPFETQLDKLVASGRASPEAIKSHKDTHNGNQPRVVAMQFGCRKRQWVVPMETAGIWTRKELEKIVKLVTRKLKECINVFHNGKFDALWMLVRFGAKWRVDHDTMLRHYLIDENDQHGLKYLAQKYLGAPDWDVNGKEKTSWSSKNAKYAAHDVYYTRKLHFILKNEMDEDHDVRRVYNKIMMPCVQLFIEAEYKGVYIKLDQMDDAEAYLREELDKALNNLERWAKKATKVDSKTGKLNWGSSDQLGHLLFTDLKIKPIDKTKGGKNSVSESVLLRIDHPMVGDLLKWRAASKQLSSFIEGWKPYLDIHGRLHPVFKLHGTVTGRLSCEHPNLQQVPRDPRIRTLITAPEGWTLCEMDLSQIELRIAAELADEHAMLHAFSTGVDVHWLTAIREIERGGGYAKEVKKTAKLGSGKKMSYSEAIDYILKLGPDVAQQLMDMWKEVRKKAKAINFGYLYGMWWKKFKLYARDNYGVDVTDEQAQQSREAFFDLYGGYPKWHDKQRRFSQVNGYVRSLSGRKRRLPAASGGRDTPQRREAQRQAINSPVQSFANELNLMAALQMREEFKPKWFRLVGTVHDAVLVEVRNDHVADVWKRGLEIMAQPSLLKDFEIDLSVPIEAEAKLGPWGEGKDLIKWQAANPPKSYAKSERKRMAKTAQRLWDREKLAA